MAIIGKIREKSGLLVAMVGLGLLLFIIPVNDLLQQFNRNGNTTIGLFNNSEIDSKIWKYNEIEKSVKEKYPSANDDEIKLRSWGQMISDTIYSTELEKLGLHVSIPELNEGILNSQNPIPSDFKNIFIDRQTGIFKQKEFAEEVFNIRKSIQNEPDPNYILRLINNLEKPVILNRKLIKYSSMLKYGVLGTIQEGKKLDFEEKTVANIDYIFVNYNDIADSVIDINDEKRKDYFNDDEHRYDKKWKQNNDIAVYDYVVIKFDPSADDIAYYTSSMESLKTSFKNAEDDSLFVANNVGIYSDQPYRGGNFSSFIDQQIDDASQGDVIGPFIHQDKVKLVKVYKTEEEEQAKVRHILISSKEVDANDTENKKLADSILYAVRRDSSKFTKLVQKYSEDPGSVSNGGVISWFSREADIVPEFKDFSFNNRIGSSGLVRTQFGFHIIQVLGRRNGTLKKIAIVDEAIMARQNTQDLYYDSVAINFYLKADTAGLTSTADEFGYEVKSSGDVPLTYFNNNSFNYLERTKQNNFYGPNELNRSLIIAKWAFNAEIGDIFEPEYISHNKIVIAQLKEKITADNDQFNNIKGLMEPYVKNKLKADYFINNNENVISEINNLDSIAFTLGYQTQNGTVKYSDLNIGNNQYNLPEPKVMANIFNMESSSTSSIIEGKQGLYIIRLNSINNSPVTSASAEEKSNKLETDIRTQIEQSYYPALLKAYQVKDRRAENLVLYN